MWLKPASKGLACTGNAKMSTPCLLYALRSAMPVGKRCGEKLFCTIRSSKHFIGRIEESNGHRLSLLFAIPSKCPLLPLPPSWYRRQKLPPLPISLTVPLSGSSRSSAHRPKLRATHHSTSKSEQHV